MKKHSFFLLLSFIAAVWFAACKKDPEPAIIIEPPDYTVLPPATQTGANTFGCLVDGKVWVPRIPFGVITYRDKEASLKESDGSGTGTINCHLTDIDESIDHWFNMTLPVTKLSSGNFCEPIPGVRAFLRTTTGDYYESKYGKSDFDCISITNIDTIKNIISGTFEFTLYKDSLNLSNRILISDGRFDLLYYPY